jgi:hypothetical protein
MNVGFEVEMIGNEVRLLPIKKKNLLILSNDKLI